MTEGKQETTKMTLDNVPVGVRNSFKATCSTYGATMRQEIMSFMRARGGDVESLKHLIHNLLTQLCDELVVSPEINDAVSLQHDFESFAFPNVNDEPESIEDALIDHIPEDKHDYVRERVGEIEASGRDVTDADYRQIDSEWEKIEGLREELQERCDDEKGH